MAIVKRLLMTIVFFAILQSSSAIAILRPFPGNQLMRSFPGNILEALLILTGVNPSEYEEVKPRMESRISVINSSIAYIVNFKPENKAELKLFASIKAVLQNQYFIPTHHNLDYIETIITQLSKLHQLKMNTIEEYRNRIYKEEKRWIIVDENEYLACINTLLKETKLMEDQLATLQKQFYTAMTLTAIGLTIFAINPMESVIINDVKKGLFNTFDKNYQTKNIAEQSGKTIGTIGTYLPFALIARTFILSLFDKLRESMRGIFPSL